MLKHLTINLLVASLAVLALVPNALAEDVTVNSHQVTTPPSNARFEVVQSTLAAKWTFRLDRYTGRVWQLVTIKDDKITWEELQILKQPKIQAPSRPRFQLFTSGLAARHTFLLDTDTGKTWLIVTDKRKANDGTEYEVNFWEPFAE